jgi:predicted ATPase
VLRSLHIRNFKGWKDTGNIELAPITLFFGGNSSGKSSIGQFLMLLKQTVESQDRKAVLNPGGSNTAVELGSYQDMIYRHKTTNKLSFSYAWDMPGIIKTPHGNKKAIFFEANIGLTGEKNPIPVVYDFSYRLGEFSKDYSSLREDFAIGVQKSDAHDDRYKLTGSKEHAPLRRIKGRAWPLRDTIRFYGFPEELFSYYQDTTFVQDVQFQHERLFASLHYLGPLRTKTNRLYSWSGLNPQNVGYDGENTIPAILAARDRQFNFGSRMHYKAFEAVVAQELERMELIDSFKVEQILEDRQQYEVKVKVNNSSSWVDLPDVGFGVSQVLPVLVQCFYAPENSIIIIEQPEIHLHPKAQSALADTLINVIRSRENGRDRNIQLIIETHSEHFLRRLQRRVADQTILETDIKAYFADNSFSTTKLEKLQIDEYGNISNWPENFFGDEMGDITEHTKAMMHRRMEGEQ